MTSPSSESRHSFTSPPPDTTHGVNAEPLSRHRGPPRSGNEIRRSPRPSKTRTRSAGHHGWPLSSPVKKSPADQKTVAASMLRQGIEGVSPRKFTPVSTTLGVDTYHLPDRVHRKWDQGALDKVWISDVTYLRANEGWLYLCAVRDGCSRRVLGWALDSLQKTDLVERALRMAKTLCGEQMPGQVVFHTDYAEVFVKPRKPDSHWLAAS